MMFLRTKLMHSHLNSQTHVARAHAFVNILVVVVRGDRGVVRTRARKRVGGRVMVSRCIEALGVIHYVLCGRGLRMLIRDTHVDCCPSTVCIKLIVHDPLSKNLVGGLVEFSSVVLGSTPSPYAILKQLSLRPHALLSLDGCLLGGQPHTQEHRQR